MRKLLSGNEAIAEGALAAGCSFFAGYPITPSSEIMHYMARELPKRGGVFIQAEDELAAVNIVIGASLAGAKAMTATSGPGFSLMQEGIGYAVMVEAPIVVVDVMRVGPATGQATKPAQGDIMQARWGRHGDQYIVSLAPSTPQEAFELTIEAFNIAEELRVPVILLIDEFIAHGREVVVPPKLVTKYRRTVMEGGEEPFNSMNPRIAPPLPELGSGKYLLITGSTHDGWGYRDVHNFETHFNLVKRLRDKIMLNLDRLFMYEAYGNEDPDVLFISYGSTARSVKEAVNELRSRGVKAKLIRLKTLWPIDLELIKRLGGDPKVVIVPEQNLGQLIMDVERIYNPFEYRVIGCNKVGGGIPIYSNELVEEALKVLGSGGKASN
ncbi:MAG: 2-oxoacid:acceptor oxidoreductase subunit alpha [Sulfolobales archaeon]|nr:2-oxoacid:acceptor oxidoreductase subunit alpha [Sulfolobales archaeon]MCX8199064.1 2-oxoacid:acceptor oxidoreductase subunit alpha [Sulfolobales archaeon]MDW8170043.1 2-oxoacid:acceptor oxidoreductase subunit alpha [Desulfurococcaceae archaeon]